MIENNPDAIYYDCCGECLTDQDAAGICDIEDACIGDPFECEELRGACGDNCSIVCPTGENSCEIGRAHV